MKYIVILIFLVVSGCTVKTAHYSISDPVWIEERKIIRIDTVTVRGNKFKIIKYRENIFK